VPGSPTKRARGDAGALAAQASEQAVRLAERVLEDLAVLARLLEAADPALLAGGQLAQAQQQLLRLIASLHQRASAAGSQGPPAAPQQRPAPAWPLAPSWMPLAPAASHLHPLPQPSHPLAPSPHPPPAQAQTTVTPLHGAPSASVSSAATLPANVSVSDFVLLETLGTGTFGKVRLCRHRATGRFYCMKILSKEKIVRMKQQEHVQNEKWVLSQVSHPFIVRLYRTFQDDSYLYFLMEYISGGELFTCIRRSSRLSNPVAKFYAAEIALAISYLHSMNIVHRDLKPENLLLDQQGHIKLTDFGFAKALLGPDGRTYTMCGTPEYIAPEVILSKGHGTPADYWSLGVLIYEMLAGHPPFFGDSNHTVFEKILQTRPHYPSDFDPLARDLVERLLQPDPERRLCSLEELKQQPWFQGVQWDLLPLRLQPGPIVPRLQYEYDTCNFVKCHDVHEEHEEFHGDKDLFKDF
jgi:serine/threonine protein kinase